MIWHQKSCKGKRIHIHSDGEVERKANSWYDMVPEELLWRDMQE